MVRLVKHASGRKVFHVQFEFLSSDIIRSNYHPRVAFDLLIKSRKRKAALVTNLLALNVNYLRIDERVLLRRSALVRNVHHKDPFRDPNLRSGKPNSTCLIHRREHLIDQFFKFLSEALFGHRFRDRKQHRVRIMNDLHVRHKRE